MLLSFSRSICRTGALAAVKKKGVGGVRVSQSVATIELPTDPASIASHCIGAAVFKDDEDPMILADDQYPEWLSTIRTNGPPTLDELDPNTVDYWQTLIELNYKQRQIDLPKPKHRRLKEF